VKGVMFGVWGVLGDGRSVEKGADPPVSPVSESPVSPEAFRGVGSRAQGLGFEPGPCTLTPKSLEPWTLNR